MSGGFIGVDVFFVLSGYLIGSIIFGQLNLGSFSFTEFYFRRLRRLFPVYTVVIIFTLIFSYQIMLPGDLKQFGQSIVASSLYLSNFLFYLEAGYFDTSAHVKPLLHTWSLSVEEQFYLFFPLVAWLTAKSSQKTLVIIFGGLGLLSFIASVVFINHDSSAVFFLFPFRAWELFLGVILAFRFFQECNSKVLTNALSVAGLMLVIYPAVYLKSNSLFPGFNALAPCIGTALIIYSGVSRATFVHKLLATTPMVWIGKLSYSLYLWHWPFFVLYTYYLPEDPVTSDILLLLSFTFLASYLSWKYIETPFRSALIPIAQSRMAIFSATFVISVLSVGAGYLLHYQNGAPHRLNSQTLKFAKAAGDLFGDLSYCKQEDNAIYPGIGFCEIGNIEDSESYALIWGDSHAGMFKSGFEKAFNANSTSALMAWTGGCPPVFGIEKDENVSSSNFDQACTIRNNAIKELLLSDPRIQVVILTGRWSYYLSGEGVGVDAENRIKLWREGDADDSNSGITQNQIFVHAFEETVKELHQKNKKVFIVEQPPEFSNYRSRKLAVGLLNNNKDIESNLDRLTNASYQSVEDRQKEMQAKFQELADQDLATILRTHSYFCDDMNCSAIQNQLPLYFDNNHLSSLGAESISDIFIPAVDEVSQR